MSILTPWRILAGARLDGQELTLWGAFGGTAPQRRQLPLDAACYPLKGIHPKARRPDGSSSRAVRVAAGLLDAANLASPQPHILMATQCSCQDTDASFASTIVTGGYASASPAKFIYTLPSSPAAEVALAFGLRRGVTVLLGEWPLSALLAEGLWSAEGDLVVARHEGAPGYGPDVPLVTTMVYLTPHPLGVALASLRVEAGPASGEALTWGDMWARLDGGGASEGMWALGGWGRALWG